MTAKDKLENLVESLETAMRALLALKEEEQTLDKEWLEYAENSLDETISLLNNAAE